MPEARLKLTIPDNIWLGELTREFPETTFTVLSALPDEGTGVALAELTWESPSAVLDRMAATDTVTQLDVLNDREGYALVQFETTVPLLLLAARDSGVPLELPFEIRDGTAVWELTTSSDRLSELGRQLDAFDIQFNIEQLRYRVSDEPLLTDSQRDLVETAVELGYYDTPRTCSLTELADEIGQAKSTVSETLHRAEERIVKQHIDRGE